MAHVLDAAGDKVERAGASSPATGTGANPARPYDAFISYSQRGDKAIAQALRSVIQTIGKPWWKVRSLNVFLDATSLSAAPGLWQSIADKLDRARYLILLASPEAAQSKWVDKEVAHFIGEDGAGLDRVLIGLTGGDLAWDSTAGDFRWNEATPLPPSLRGRFREEPLWVDLRPFRAEPSRATKSDQAFLHAALDLAATIKGVEKADLYSDEVRLQRRSARLAYGIASGVVILAIGAGAAAWIAVEQRERAEAEATRATQEAERANKEATHAMEALASSKNTIDLMIYDVLGGLDGLQGYNDRVQMILFTVKSTINNLIISNPEDMDLQSKYLGILSQIGKQYASIGDINGAISAYNDSVMGHRDLARLSNNNPEAVRGLWYSLLILGKAKFENGDGSGARAAMEEALELARQLAAQETERGECDWRGLPGDDDGVECEKGEGQDAVAHTLREMADLALESGDYAGMELLNESIAISRSIVESYPEYWYIEALIEVLNHRGDMELAFHKREDALTSFSEALELSRKLASDHEDIDRFQIDFLSYLYKFGGTLAEMTYESDALDTYVECVEAARRLAGGLSGDIIGQYETQCLGRSAYMQAKLGQRDIARKSFDEAVERGRKLKDEYPDELRLKEVLLRNLAAYQVIVGDKERRKLLIDEAIIIIDEIEVDESDSPTASYYRKFLEEQSKTLE